MLLVAVARTTKILARIAKVLTSISAGLLVLVGGLTAARAAGTWGATGAPYVDGVVCQQGDTSAPLASWDFGTGSPAFLLAPVSSARGVDSAALPFAASGTQRTAAVTPGTDGFGGSEDIAAYAYLISHARPGAATQVAAIARAVMARSGSDGVPDCATGTDQLVQDARALAGPYTVQPTSPATPAVMGAPTVLSATVTSATGRPVPGVSVVFTSSEAASPSLATTGADGVAQATLTIRAGVTASAVTWQASVSAAVGLEEVIAYRPDGSPTIGAVYAAPPVTVAANGTVRIDSTAQPAVQATPSAHAIVLGQSVQQFADVSGLRGHTADVALTVLGPVAAAADGGCSATSFSPSTPTATKTATVSISGDQRVAAAAWTPSASGCYSVLATVQTTNATPDASARSNPGAGGSLLAVVAASAVLHAEHAVVGAGPVKAQLTLNRGQGLHGSVTGEVLGPVRPSGASCAAVDFAHARRAVTLATSTVPGDGVVTLTSGELSAAGCYRLQASVALTVGGLGVVELPVTADSVQMITPVLTTSVDRVWAISPSAIDAVVAVRGTNGQASHLSVELAYVPVPPLGCQAVDWAAAKTTAAGRPQPIRGDGDRYAVRSGPTPAFGCYLPVARLTVDANPAITVTAALANHLNAVGVGVDPNAKEQLGGRISSARALAPLWLLCLVLVAAQLSTGVAVGGWVWSRQRRDH